MRRLSQHLAGRLSAVAVIGGLALALAPSPTHAQSQPQIDPRNARQGQPITPDQLNDAFQRAREAEARAAEAAAEAEEQRRQEELDRRNAAERARTRHYRLTCRVIGVIVSEDDTRVSCDDVADVYPGHATYEHATDHSTYWVYSGSHPTFAASAASVATDAMIANRRVRIDAHRGPDDHYTIMTVLSVE